MKQARSDMFAPEGASGALVVSVKEANGAVGCLSAHLAHAAQRAGMRVLVADLTRGAALDASFPPPAGTATSKLGPDVISPWLSIIRTDLRLRDASLCADDIAQRLATSLTPLLGRYDLCLVEVGDDDPTAVSALMARASFVVTSSTAGYRASGPGPKRLKRLLTAAKAAGQVNRRLAGITLLPLDAPLSTRFHDLKEQAMADRVLYAIVGERALSYERMAA